jgi:AcrR family transcriptional regulator
MKTKDRILQTSLLLFNEEGEPNVTTVDIANEMEISPGNLYYHFRGKEIIIEELYDQFDREMTDILTAPIQKKISVQDSWFYLYVVFEHIYSYRFLYFNLTDIMHRYEKIQRRFKRLLKSKTATARSMCNDMVCHNVLSFSSDDEAEALVNQVVLTILYWMSFNMLNERMSKNPELIMHEGVFQVMSVVAPHMLDEKKQFFNECKSLYQELIKNARTKNV